MNSKMKMNGRSESETAMNVVDHVRIMDTRDISNVHRQQMMNPDRNTPWIGAPLRLVR